MVSLSELRFEHGAWWWVLLVPPVLLGGLHLWAWWFRRAAARSFAARGLVLAMTERRSPGRRVGVAVLVLLGLEALVLAGLRPRYGLREVTVAGAGVDVAIVLDASRSMKAQDVAPDRLTAAVIEIGRILDGMPGNRVTLVPFAGLAFIQTPLTLDHEVVKEYLANLKVTDIPVPGTALGRALRVAASALGLGREGAGGSTRKVVLVFTDGENHEGEPEKVAEELAGHGVRIYTIGVGTPAGQPVPILDDHGQVVGTAREKDGVTPVLSKLNEELLKAIAQKTSGRYFGLTSVGGVAEDLLKEMASIEKAEYQARIEKLLEDRFQYPLAAGLGLLACAFLLLGGARPRAGPVAVAVAVLLLAGTAQARGIFEKAHGGVEAALELLASGKAGDAAKALEGLVGEMPGRPDLLYDLALARDAAGEHEEAVRAVDQALGALAQAKEQNPEWPSRARLLHAKGTILMHQAKRVEKEKPREARTLLRQAVDTLAEALALDPEASDTLRNLELAAMAAYPPCSKLDDPREPNETPSEAPFLTPNPNDLTIHEDLMLCPDNVDWFRLPLRVGEALLARVLDPQAGEQERPAAVDMTLLDRGERELAPKGKQAMFTAREEAEVLVQVTGPKEEDGIPYRLDARIIPPCPAGDDGLEDNDSREAGRPIEDGDHALRICAGDDDWFQYVEKQGQQKEVALVVPEGEGPLEMEVFLADGAPVAVTRTGAAGEGTTVLARLPKAEQDAPFSIRVFGGGNEGFYSLSIRDAQGGGQEPQQDRERTPPERPEPQGARTMREQLDSIDRNDENLEAKEAARKFPAREYVPEKDW